MITIYSNHKLNKLMRNCGFVYSAHEIVGEMSELMFDQLKARGVAVDIDNDGDGEIRVVLLDGITSAKAGIALIASINDAYDACGDHGDLDNELAKRGVESVDDIDNVHGIIHVLECIVRDNYNILS